MKEIDSITQTLIVMLTKSANISADTVSLKLVPYMNSILSASTILVRKLLRHGAIEMQLTFIHLKFIPKSHGLGNDHQVHGMTWGNAFHIISTVEHCTQSKTQSLSFCQLPNTLFYTKY